MALLLNVWHRSLNDLIKCTFLYLVPSKLQMPTKTAFESKRKYQVWEYTARATFWVVAICYHLHKSITHTTIMYCIWHNLWHSFVISKSDISFCRIITRPGKCQPWQSHQHLLKKLKDGNSIHIIPHLWLKRRQGLTNVDQKYLAPKFLSVSHYSTQDISL